MKKKIYLLILTLIFLLQLKTLAEEITYKDTLNAAINNSFDLKMSQLDIGISKAQLKSVRADWYPSLSIYANCLTCNILSNLVK